MSVEYDEFALLAENAAEAGLPWSGPPPVRRQYVDVDGGRRVSALVWGVGPPRVALLHGGGQNAHTWDTVALALGFPVVAIDLPGHGHSDWRPDHDYSPSTLADDVATALAALAPDSAMLVGMSLGGIAGLAAAWRHPELVRRLALVDITPGADAARAEPIVAFLSGPDRFASFEEIVERTVAFNPSRSVAALRRERATMPANCRTGRGRGGGIRSDRGGSVTNRHRPRSTSRRCGPCSTRSTCRCCWSGGRPRGW